MVIEKYVKQRSAIAMIELIFAIVVMGITLMSTPMLVSLAGSSATVSYQQEAIAIAATHTSNLMTYHWDEQNTQQFKKRILQAAGDADLDVSANGIRGNSLFFGSRVRIFDTFNNPTATAPASLGLDTGETIDSNSTDDIDDWIDNDMTMESISTSQNTDDGEYIDDSVLITTTVFYTNDTAAYDNARWFAINNIGGTVSATTTNIKAATVTLTSGRNDAELNKTITFRAFLCNIGAVDLDSGVF